MLDRPIPIKKSGNENNSGHKQQDCSTDDLGDWRS
jgi:hypothetical protein